MDSIRRAAIAAFIVAALPRPAFSGENLLEDPSFEVVKDRDQFGLVFAKWGGWRYEGDCSFEVGAVARSGKRSALLAGASAPKIRIAASDRELEPGRYRITAYLRGLDIGVGLWNQSTEFMFDGKYFPLGKHGTFGWTPLTYVVEIAAPKKVVGPSFGLWGVGFLWIDDVTLEKMPGDTPLTEKPVLGAEEAPIAPPGELGPGAVRCGFCGYRGMPAWKMCYACGNALEERRRAAKTGPPVARIASFEEKNPFSGEALAAVEEHATDGTKALRLDRSYASMEEAQDWSGYDLLKVDLFTDSPDPLGIYVEIRDKGTRDYWTRVNYVTVAPPGQSTLVVPIRLLYVGEKSRPGRPLDLAGITRLVIAHADEAPRAPLYIDNLRVERDEETAKALFDGLFAFDFGTGTSPVFDGFTAIAPATTYSRGRGYGLADARIWRSFDALQPDPLYQDFICIESGGLAVDLPNGAYRVLVNADSPSGYWGEFQVYSERAILAEGKEVAKDALDFERFKARYFRFWDVEDTPGEDTFDKYQRTYFREKVFDVQVDDGQLNLEFKGENWACCVSAVIILPKAKAAEGEKFLKYVEQRRRFYFDNYFKRILHRPTGDPVAPTAEEKARGYVIFARDFMEEIFPNDTPFRGEIRLPLAAEAFAGEYEPLTFGLVPLEDLGAVTVAASDLVGPEGRTIPRNAIDVAFVSNRLSRVTMEGSVYTIAPRLLVPRDAVNVAAGVARRFWLTVRTPLDASPGVYEGSIAIRPERGKGSTVPVRFRVRKGTLDPVDIPVGPWGHTIDLPWPGSEATAWNDRMAAASLRKLREYGFTTVSGLPELRYEGFKDGKPAIDFSRGDAQMRRAREAGFTMPVVTYCALHGLNVYYRDTAAMGAAGLTDYSDFVRRIFSEIQKHADATGWLPVYWNLGDEPIGDNLTLSAENAEAYRAAFPHGPPFFTAASSYAGTDPNDPHFRLARALHVVNWNLHSEESVKLLQKAGSDWAFYNGGNRWTFGIYLYKAAKQFGMKFRLSWHWNVVAGDPYYALDCREDDYAWCNSSPDGQLIPSLEFERLREGLDDYRHMLTLARLAAERAGAPAAAKANELIAARLGAFRLGQRDHDSLFGAADWATFRRAMAGAIEELRR